MAYLPTMFSKFVTVSAAEILGMNTNPVLLLAGVAGAVINLESLLLIYSYNSVAFNPGSDDQVIVFMGAADGSNTALSQDASGTPAQGFVDQTVPTVSWQITWMQTDSPNNAGGNVNGGILSTVLRGSGVYLTQFNSSDGFPNGANWTQGNGEITVLLRYSLIKA